MDYTALINLALVTVLYSTFIAPGLKKLGEQRDDIADTEFPLRNNTDNEKTDKNIFLKGTELDKKITQYEDKHDEIKVFLYFFYGILIALFAVQIGLLIYIGKYELLPMVSLLGSIVVTLLLGLTIKAYMIAPWQIRSIQWLAGKKVAPVYANILMRPILMLNSVTANHIHEEDEARFSIRTKAKFAGYRYILLVESKNYKRLYYATWGRIGKYTPYIPLMYPNGDLGYEIMFPQTKLKSGNYNARLLIFNAPLGGTINVAETQLNFKVENSSVPARSVAVGLTADHNSHYKFTCSKNLKRQKIKKIEYDESFEGDKNILTLLSSENFYRLFRKVDRSLVISNRNGNLDKYTIQRLLSRRHVAWRKCKFFVTFRFLKRKSLRLS